MLRRVIVRFVEVTFVPSFKLSKIATCMEPGAKRLHTMKTIGTHNGSFHCDEALACFMLKQLPQFKDAEVIRTRDPKVLGTCDIVVDVGGTFEPEKLRFDHHQRTFGETMNSLLPEKKWKTKLSSAGLVYLHFGKQLLAQVMEKEESDPAVDIIFDKVYENFVEEIDAIDNGVNQTDEQPRYRITTHLSSRVSYLNPGWQNPDDDPDACFQKAMQLVGTEFLDRVNYYSKVWLAARDGVLEVIKQRKEVDPSGEIICFKDGGLPWKDHLFSIEQELELSPTIKYVLFADQNGAWRVQCVPLRLGAFDNRLSLPEPWRGIRDEALSELSGIPDCIFVHASGFIGGNKTYDGVLKMAQKSLEMAKSS